MSDDKQLDEILERFTYDTDQWAEIRSQAAIDMQFVSGDPWNDDDKKQREGRPTVAPDELHQYFNQVINGLRANPRGMKFSPTGNGANDDGARWYENKARETEYRSHAQLAYVTAAENAIQQGFGWCRLTTKYESDRSNNQEIWIDDIPNPHSILSDSDSKRPDSSDMKHLFMFEPRLKEEFKREFPKAKVTNFDSFPDSAKLWIQEKTILLAEYWKIKTVEKELLTFSTGESLFRDELKAMPSGVTVARTRKVEVPSVCQYLTNGLEILKTTEWPGKYIPFASCFGKVIYVDGKRQLLSMTRAGREPWKLYCYYRSQQAEMAGMIPKVPVQAYKGQMASHETDWQKANHEPVAFLYFNGITPDTGSTVLPPPSRLDYKAGEHLQSLELCAEGARRAIQAAMSVGFLPTSAQRRNEKSGIALKQIDESAQRGSFHFDDHYNDMIRHVGIMFEDLADKIYDTARDVGIRKADESSEIVRINDPEAKNADGQPQHVSTKGSYLVTVSTGQSFNSEREAGSDLADSIIGSKIPEMLGPEKAPKLIAAAIRLKNVGVHGDEMAEIIDPKDKENDPHAAQQKMAQMGHQMQEMGKALQQAGLEKHAKLLELQSHEKIAAQEIQSKERLEVRLQAMKGATALGVAKINALTKGVVSDNEAQMEAIALAHEAEQNEHDRQHEAILTAMGHEMGRQNADEGAQRDAAAADQGQAHALEAGDVGHQQALEASQQAADLAPQPEAGV